MALPPPDKRATALVTGASSGIGAELARGLARRGHGVTLVARREERLRSLVEEVAGEHGVRAEALAADLSREEGRDRVAHQLEELGLRVDVLVNNAGFGIYQPFASSDRERELQQARLLVEAVVDLSSRYVPGMVERGAGAVLNMSSTSGFQPLPGSGTYAAAKAYVLFHSEALHEELRDSGVTVTVVCPGPVATEFQEVGKPLFMEKMPAFVWRQPDRVAEESLRALERGKRTIVPGGRAIEAAFAPTRTMPAALTLPVTRWLFSGELRRS
jgi:short-subunit dehydrogenase